MTTSREPTTDSDRSRSTRKRLPNLLIIGVTKAGTTSLFSYLAQHPQICGSRPKEAEYFSELAYADGRLADLGSYRRHFRHCGDQRYVMEATANYWYGGEATRSALERILDNPRYIVVLRDPVDRFWSDYTYMQSKRLLPRALGPHEFLEECMAARASGGDFSRTHRYYRTISTGFYGEHLLPWIDQFGGRLRLIFFEDLAASPDVVVSDLFRWLELNPAPADTIAFSVENPTLAHRNELLQQLAYGTVHRIDRFLRLFPRFKSALTSAYYVLNRSEKSTASMNQELRSRLDEIYKDANRKLARDLKQRGVARLPSWLEG